MSAYVVDKAHIDYLVHAMLAVVQLDHSGSLSYGTERPWKEASRETMHDVGRMLWAANVASVLYCYPDCTYDNMPGPVDLDHEAILTYRCPLLPRKPFAAVTALKAINGYEYQACEHPGWIESDARDFCDQLRRGLIRHLPGYDEAPWEITDDTPAPKPLDVADRLHEMDVWTG